MLFTIVINQLAAVHSKSLDLDLNEIAVLNVIKDAQANPKIETYREKDQTWYWVSTEWVKNALPIVFKPDTSLRNVYRKIKQLVDLGYCESNPELSKKKNKSFYRLTSKGMNLFQNTELDFKTVQDAENYLSEYTLHQNLSDPTPKNGIGNTPPTPNVGDGPTPQNGDVLYNNNYNNIIKEEDSILIEPNNNIIPAREILNFPFPFRELAKGMEDEILSEYEESVKNGSISYFLHEYKDYLALDEGLSVSKEKPALERELLEFLKSGTKPKQFYFGNKVLAYNKKVILKPIHLFLFPPSTHEIGNLDLSRIPDRYFEFKKEIQAILNK